MQEVPPSLSEFAERELRGRGIEVRTAHHAARGPREPRAASPAATRSPARTLVWTAGVKPSPVVARSGLPLDDGRLHRRCRRCGSMRASRAASRAAAARVGDRRLRRGARRRAAGAAVPADGAARDPPGPAGRAQRRRRARGRGAPRPFRYRTKGVVAELGHNAGGGDHARDPLARAAGVADRAHLPPAADARAGAQAAAAGRLERGAAVRPRRLLAGAARQPDAARAWLSGSAEIAAAAYPESGWRYASRSKPTCRAAMRAGEKERVGALRLRALRAAEGRQGGARRRARGAAPRAQAPARGGRRAFRDARPRGPRRRRGGARRELIGGYLPAELSDEELGGDRRAGRARQRRRRPPRTWASR